jgi:hypothetical protein
MPETSIHAAEIASLEALTLHLSKRGVGPAKLRALVEAMGDALRTAADLVKTHPDDAERGILRIARYLDGIADDYAAVPDVDPGVIEIDPEIENPTACAFSEDCVLPFGHDGDHDFAEDGEVES